jgi:apolipoprotein D and lipocalin family protein
MRVKTVLQSVAVRLALVVIALAGSACSSTGVPAGIQPVAGFELERYLGTWYEIARIDNRFEQGLEAVSATYRVREDGSVGVLNRGWNTADGGWVEADGRAKFVGAEDVAHLAVSFFGPFFASYVVFELDEFYQNAWVTGNDRKTLWYLSREPVVDPAALAAFRYEADALGFDLGKIIDVDQTRNR